ncbi:MAG: hypothetical protein M0Z80_15575 [Treponema sp.]|nr:hypothetical protein [Treponema sp.]
MKAKLVLLEGFLGSGKTTLMLALGRSFASRGLKTGYITNDQGAYLVDTLFAQGQSSATAEVTGSCFCCNFPALADNIAGLQRAHEPDLIIAEAVGSCTDLAATVVLPIQEGRGGELELAAYYVVVDGSRLADEYSARMNLLDPRSPTETLLAHQIAEAETLVVTKLDCLDEEELAEGRNLLRRINPRARLFSCSARDGRGLEALLDDILGGRGVTVAGTPSLDYEVYAQAEAEYGWYNGQWEEAEVGSDWELFLRRLAEGIGAEIAHAKVLAESPERMLKVSLAGGRIERDEGRGRGGAGPTRVTLNVRARSSPDRIVAAVEELIRDRRPAGYRFEALVPSPPSPTYRMSRSLGS